MSIIAMAEKYCFHRYYIGGSSLAGLNGYDINTVLGEELKNLSTPYAENIYKIELVISAPVSGKNVAKNSRPRRYGFYVADDIKTDTQILADVQKKYDEVLNALTPVGKPAVLERAFNKIFYSTRPTDTTAQPRKTPLTIIDWHILNPNKDIVVDRKLHQIYPVKTNAYPVAIQKLLEKQHQ